MDMYDYCMMKESWKEDGWICTIVVWWKRVWKRMDGYARHSTAMSSSGNDED